MIIDIVNKEQHRKIHPHKFTLWVAIGSIIMMFAGLTSAYIVKSQQAAWQEITTPKVFWYSTIVILLSSLTIQMALRSFKQRNMSRYRQLMAVTVLLGAAFVVLQSIGFQQFWNSGIQFKGVAGAGQFLYVIFGLHALHVLGGVIALLVMFVKAFFGRVKTYSSTGIEVAATYWHFVDILWIYLLVFFLWIG
ncbi:MAG TPA: heme-copper oxidase subunit III [Chitinophagaceae bacterium]|nr:heme-copper oxidase subunit III [Chitinophagaceae bacterium]